MAEDHPQQRLLEQSFATDEDAPFHARQFLRQACADKPRLDDLLLMASELITNAVLHGPPGRVLMKVIDGHKRTRIEVHQPPGGRQTLNPTPAGSGYGLKIVAALSDAWGTGHPGWSGLWFELANS